MANIIITSHFNNDLASQACAALGLEKHLILYMSKIKKLNIDVNYECYENIETYSRKLLKLKNEGKLDFIWSTSGSEKNSIAELKAVERAGLSDIYLGMNEKAVFTAGFKNVTQELLAALGITIASGVQCKTKQEIRNFFETHGGTIICKANNGAGGVNQFYCNNHSDVSNLPSEVNDWYVERFMKGLEFSVNAFMVNGYLTASPIMFKGETDVKIAHAMDKFRSVIRLHNKKFNDEVNDILMKIFQSNVFNGWIEVEFIKTENELIVIEINARYNGTIRATSYACAENLYQIDLENRIYNTAPAKLENKNEVIEIPINLNIGTGLKKYGFIQQMKSRTTNSGRATIWGEDKEEILHKIQNTELALHSQQIINDLKLASILFDKYC